MLVMDIIHEVYLVTNRVNKKCYIGQVKQRISGRLYGVDQRWNKHCLNAKKNKNQCVILENAIRKYGDDNFSVIVLCMCFSDEVDILEQTFIKSFNCRFPNGYNIESGGCEGKELGDITKTKISEGHRFSGVLDEYKIRIKSSMKELGITSIPQNIWYKRPDKRGMEGFIVNMKEAGRKQFSAKSLTLTEKLDKAIKYLKLSMKGGDEFEEEKSRIKNQEMTMSATRRKDTTNPIINKALADNKLEHLPMYVYFNKTYNYFIYARPSIKSYKSFKDSDPSRSLYLAIKHLNSLSR